MPANTNVRTSRTPHIWKTIWQESLKLEFAMEVLPLEHFCPRLGDISELLNNLNWELLFKRNWIFQLHFQTLYFCTLIRLLAKKKKKALHLSVISGAQYLPPHSTSTPQKELRMEKVYVIQQDSCQQGSVPRVWALILCPSTCKKMCNKSNKQAGFTLENISLQSSDEAFPFYGTEKN